MQLSQAATNGLAALGVAAIMLIEDVGDGLVTVPADVVAEERLAATLAALGAYLSALAAAAAVLTRHRRDEAERDSAGLAWGVRCPLMRSASAR